MSRFKANRPNAHRAAVSRRHALMIGAGAVLGAGGAWTLLRPTASVAGPAITVWKSPECGCCGGWVAYMRRRGYPVTINETEDMSGTKERLGVPEELQSCHTARIEGYLLEGHVPEPAVAKLLRERPADVAGLALPGMPEGAPGMDGKRGTYGILAFGKDRRSRLFMTSAG